ncbi:AraC family transcriptional regulator [Blastochloris sulfoviridis]|uniref:AraC family transcriptional regulator n=1 Tax=Blastochloris sulfoviridis TaxID=50712 RepID=A0A5M6I0V7_9HYPH|nr:AraC family transcriptional regulator [Blastochloris sulfoviridis]KAA5601821.1 AraC family transcriptional regulator [Blastochloris sulfoviridis]
MEPRTISPLFVDEAVDCLRRAGIAPGPVLAAAGLPEAVREPLSAERYGALWLAVSAAMDDEFFGLGGRPMRPGSFTLLCHAVLHAGTLEQALNRALRFLRVTLEDPCGALTVDGSLARIVLTDRGAPRSAFAYRTFWIVLHGVACWLVGRRIPLRSVDFVCGPPLYAADYRLFFGAPVRFGQPQSALTFDAAYLKLPTMRTERSLKEFLRRAPANILVRYRHDAGLVATIRARLRALPPTAWPDFETLAREMKMPASTLRRQLRAEGQTYRTIKDEIRRALAIRWLAANDKPVGDIAAELGFTEPSAFHRAFRKWMAKSPGAFRREALEI